MGYSSAGRAMGLGPMSHRFESYYPFHLKYRRVMQWIADVLWEHVVVGSNPTSPINYLLRKY
uniref:Uncharacterized protein n=1 Tax=viral metagenome TaxID=1070528 RepID=A0A6M3LL62_9ZZZZ